MLFDYKAEPGAALKRLGKRGVQPVCGARPARRFPRNGGGAVRGSTLHRFSRATEEQDLLDGGVEELTMEEEQVKG